MHASPEPQPDASQVDVYFSADVETDGPVPGPYSMLSFALAQAGTFDGHCVVAPPKEPASFYCELKPIGETFQPEALAINGLDRARLAHEGLEPSVAMVRASEWLREHTRGGTPVLVAYPLVFDWSWLHWYFVRFCPQGSPFGHSRAFDIKTAFAVKGKRPVAISGHDHLPVQLRASRSHTHHALDDALEQAEVFAKLFQWQGG